MAQAKVDKIIIGLDFGTTFSGVAFQYAGNSDAAEKIIVIKSWPGRNSHTSEKVPTQILYKDEAAGSKWGYEIPPNELPLRCIKLLLDDGQTLPEWVDKGKLHEELNARGKSPIDVAADFLTKLHEFALDEISKTYRAVFVESTPIEYILTVPAVWSDIAKQSTLAAAKKAGIGDSIQLISKPEAAAVETLTGMKAESIREGDVYVICDAGGGTVDLITYEVENVAPTRFREVAPGSGSMCGASFLNMGFETPYRKRLGDARFKAILERSPRTRAAALTYFEDYVKRNYRPTDAANDTDNYGFSVPMNGVPDDEDAGIDFGFMSLSNEEVGAIFEPIIHDVIDLILDQFDASEAAGHVPKAVILVGGFGGSKYLHDRLKNHFQSAG
ncbi:Hypothetical protein D9617_18g033570 [Elsinoe fawcettii]|nr:Hypothetical protein D9617_18g033570 [Elsinoe fawcettii]